MAKLNKREKLLLYLLVVVLAGVAGWFLINPAIQESAALDAATLDAEMQKTAVEQAISGSAQHMQSIAETKARIETLKVGFLPLMTNDDLDRYITGLFQKNGLVAESLLISASGDETACIAVMKLSVRVTATGELEQIISLVEQLSKLRGIRIATLNVREKSLKTILVPLTPEEIADLPATAATADSKAVTKDEKTGAPVTERSVMEYGVEFGFEVMEFDEAVFAAMGG